MPERKYKDKSKGGGWKVLFDDESNLDNFFQF